MQIEANKVNDVLVLTVLNSRVSADSTPGFKDSLIRHIQEGNDKIVVNLSAVNFIDSSGLGAIIAASKHVRGTGLVVCGAHDNVLGLFKLTRMDKIFRVFATEGEAVAFFDQSSAATTPARPS